MLSGHDFPKPDRLSAIHTGTPRLFRHTRALAETATASTAAGTTAAAATTATTSSPGSDANGIRATDGTRSTTSRGPDAGTRLERSGWKSDDTTPNCAAQQVELNRPKFGQPLQATNEPASRCSLGSIVLSSLGIRQHGRRRRRLPASRSRLRVSHPPLFPPPSAHTHALSWPLAPARCRRIQAFRFSPGQPPSLPNLLSPSRSTRAYPSFFAYLATPRHLPI